MLQYLKDTWGKLKYFFKQSQVIFLARMEAAIGFVVVALSVADWSPLLSAGIDTGFSWVQAATLGSIMFIKGVITEWARRINTIEVAGKLFPADATLEEAKTAVEIKTLEKRVDVP
jgi:hypothetical protein